MRRQPRALTLTEDNKAPRGADGEEGGAPMGNRQERRER